VPEVEQKEASQARPEPGSASPSYRTEAHILSLLLRRPDLLYRLDRLLQEAGLLRLAPEDFNATDHQVLFRLVRESLEQDTIEPERYLIDNLPESLAGPMGSLLTLTVKLDPREEHLLEDIFRGVVKIRRNALNENINQLRYLQEDGQQAGDLQLAFYRETVQQYTTLLLKLDQAQLKQIERRKEAG
jgi:hypothetical protein